MSTSLSPRSAGSSGHPTRQQLDELDALLQRMLALPVNQADEDVTAEINALPKAVPTPRQEPVSYSTPEYSDVPYPVGDDATGRSTAAPRLDEAHVGPSTQATEDADNWVPLSSTWKPSPHTWKPLAQSWQQPRSTPPSTTPAQETSASREQSSEEAPSAKPTPALRPILVETAAAQVVSANAEPKPSAVVAAPPALIVEEPPLPGWMQALLWFNIAFDVLLLPWGPPGRWLRRDGGGRSLLGLIGTLLLVAAIALSALFWFGWTWDGFLGTIP